MSTSGNTLRIRMSENNSVLFGEKLENANQMQIAFYNPKGEPIAFQNANFTEMTVREIREYLGWWLGKKADEAGAAKAKAEAGAAKAKAEADAISKAESK